jgi:putative transposase
MAEHLEQAREDLLSLVHLRERAVAPDLEYQPFEERLHKEIRRRTEVAGIFPDRAAIIRLIGSLLIEQTEEWADERRSMSARGPRQGPASALCPH